jgi:hypothetical protein
MTRNEIEKRMDELARKYTETHDTEIPQRFTDWPALEKMEKLEKQ